VNNPWHTLHPALKATAVTIGVIVVPILALFVIKEIQTWTASHPNTTFAILAGGALFAIWMIAYAVYEGKGK
jgi:energy-coupling factor transporter transmembrane protein EcfT